MDFIAVVSIFTSRIHELLIYCVVLYEGEQPIHRYEMDNYFSLV